MSNTIPAALMGDVYDRFLEEFHETVVSIMVKAPCTKKNKRREEPKRTEHSQPKKFTS